MAITNKVKNMTRNDLYCPFCGGCGMRQLSESHRAQSGKRRYKCVSCSKRTTQPAYGPVQVLPKTRVTEIKKSKFFVITSAVNDTPIVTSAFETFKRVAEDNNGKLLVIPTVYKNPDLKHEGATATYTYPDDIIPYLCNANIKLNTHIEIKGETRIEHCVINPLAGLNHAGSMISEVYGHSQVAMEMVATPHHKMPKMLHTTGTVSQHNYGGSIRAQKAKFHHSISALIVEVEGDKFWTREIHFDGTGCYDLNKYYTPDHTETGWTTAGIVYGDIHIRALRKRTLELMNFVADKLDPEFEVFHDIHDHAIGNHHIKDNTIALAAQSIKGQLSIRDELMMAVEFLAGRAMPVVVDSNHNRHLDQWFNRYNQKSDPINLPLHLELGEMLRLDLINGGDGNLFKLFVEKYSPTHESIFVGPNDEFNIRGIDCSQHGDRGPNGSRGSAKSFAKSGVKTFVGHSHTPRIEKGCYQVGTSSVDMEYAQGFSSWCITHGLIYDNGKRALFNIVDGKLSPTMRKM